MTSADTEMMMNLVAEKTGYGVSLLIESDIPTWASMVSASKDSPRHVIKVNPEYSKYGDYLVAVQCAILIVKWADPSRIPYFIMDNSKVDKIVEAISKAKEVSKLPIAARSQHVKMLVHGILNQLVSAPMEIMAFEMCHELCPSLREIERETVQMNLREMTASLSPHIREQVPEEIFNKNAYMNAAFTMAWADKTGDKTALIPFETLGFSAHGEELMKAYRNIPIESDQRFALVVDAWAELLNMKGWYQWYYREG